MSKKPNNTTDPRHEARKTALQVLFEWSYQSIDVEEIIDRDLGEYASVDDTENTREVDREMVRFLVNGVTQNLDEIDKIIEDSAPEWPVEQIAKVDLEALRIAIFELHLAKSVPPKVAIDEAIELGKEFGGPNAGKFINGVLGTVVKQLVPSMKGKRKSMEAQK